MKSVIISVLVAILSWGVVASASGTAIRPSINYDLLFLSIDYETVSERTSIGKIYKWSSKTDAIESWSKYKNDVSVMPLSMSNNQKLVAVGLGNMNGMSNQICILFITGENLSCLEWQLGLYPSDFYQRLKWSTDDAKLTFFDHWATYQLVESDTLTGKTIRIVYEYAFEGVHRQQDWTHDLKQILMGTNDVLHPLTDYPLITIDQNGKIVLQQIVPIIKQNNTEARVQDVDQTTLTICPFSPKDSYVVAYDSKAYSQDKVAQEFIVYNRQNMSKKITLYYNEKSFPLPQECPVWKSDESGFYYKAALPNTPSHSIYYFDLVSQLTTLFYDSRIEPIYITGHMVISPDNHYIAFETTYNPAWKRNYGSTVPRIGIIGLNQFLKYIESPLINSTYPVWISSEKSPAINIRLTPPPPNIILPPAQPTLINPLPGGGGE
jgi:hypothetical protein